MKSEKTLIFQEKKGNLFEAESDRTLFHCVSADCEMGAGIAKQFVEKYPNLRSYVDEQWPEVGESVFYRSDEKWDVINLITKWKYYHKPTYKTLRQSLEHAKKICDDNQRIAMPMIGCGLDGLDWQKVRQIITQVFHGTNVDIVMYKL
jgi:O-acetyl-ADP-ribose deacetylase (regulator of RNase III)